MQSGFKYKRHSHAPTAPALKQLHVHTHHLMEVLLQVTPHNIASHVSLALQYTTSGQHCQMNKTKDAYKPRITCCAKCSRVAVVGLAANGGSSSVKGSACLCTRCSSCNGQHKLPLLTSNEEKTAIFHVTLQRATQGWMLGQTSVHAMPVARA